MQNGAAEGGGGVISVTADKTAGTANARIQVIQRSIL